MYETGYILFFLLIFIGIPIGIGLLLYFIPRKLGYPNAARNMTWIYGLMLGVLAFMGIFEDHLFFKKDALKLIEEQNLVLENEFKLVNNRSTGSMGDFYHTFTLEISDRDKHNIIESIKASTDFKKLGEFVKDIKRSGMDRYSGPTDTQNYETEEGFIRAYFKPNGPGYAPTFRQITVNKTGNTLVFEEIDDGISFV